jgi:hypothetical protein
LQLMQLMQSLLELDLDNRFNQLHADCVFIGREHDEGQRNVVLSMF